MDRAEAEEEVRRALDGHDLAGAAATVLRRYGPEVTRHLRMILTDEEEVSEAFGRFQEDLWRGIAGFRGESTVRVWTHSLAWRAARGLRRQAWNRLRLPLTTGVAERTTARTRSSTERFERRRAVLVELRRQLSLEDRALLVLRLDRSLSWAECAQVLSAGGTPTSVNALAKRFERIKARLARMVRERRVEER